MIVYKRVFLRIFFVLECLFFIWFHVWGRQGLVTLFHSHRDHERIKQENVLLASDIESLEGTVELHTKNLFYVEKKARETLHMGRPDEQVFFIEYNQEKK